MVSHNYYRYGYVCFIIENNFSTSLHLRYSYPLSLSFLVLLPLNVFQPENCLTSYEPHGYCVIYSSSDRDSFILAERILQTLWASENIAQRAVILVGNKADLARSRTVTSEGEWKR